MGILEVERLSKMKTNRLAIGAWALACAVALAEPGKEKARLASISRAPLLFEPNMGQADPSVRFVSRGGSASMMLTSNETFLVVRKKVSDGCGRDEAGCYKAPLWQTETIRMHLEGAHKPQSIRGLEPQPGVSNYLFGNDPSKWQTNVPNFSKVEVKGVYEGVDMVYYGNQNRLEYDFVVGPGVDPDVIRLAYDGAKLRTAENGDLLLATSLGDLRQHKPLVYQIENGKRVEIAGTYRIRGSQVSFELARYDRSKPVVIDPVLSFATYAGGSAGDDIRRIAVEGNGNAYVVGQTSSASFPVTNPGTGSTTSKVFVQKYNANNQIVYSTFYGGNDGITSGLGIAVDQANGEAVITGQTSSTSLPLVNAFLAYNSNRISTIAGSNPPQFEFFDAFVARLNAAGSGLVLSTYLGGQGNERGLMVAVDATGIYVVGETAAANFPLVKPVQSSLGGPFDAFAAKISGNQLLFGTYLGGSGIETAWGIQVQGGAMFVAGATSSNNFPTTPGAFDTTFNDTPAAIRDGFVAKINPVPAGSTNNTFAYSTYLGGQFEDVMVDVAVDAAGNAYIGGKSRSPNYPIANQWRGYSSTVDGVVTKLNANGTALVYSTFIGGGADDEVTSVAVDSTGALFFSGYSGSGNLPGVNPPGFLSWNVSDYLTSDVMVGKLVPAGNAPEYLGFYGGQDNDSIWGIGLDNNGRLWMGGQTTSPDFQTLNQVQPRQAGVDAIVMRIDPDASTAIGVPQIVAPNVGQIINTSAITMQWTAVNGATGYDLLVVNWFTQNVVFSGQLSGNGANTSVVDLVNGTYVFKVRACTGNAFTTCGYFAQRTFEVQMTAPTGTPVMTFPTAGANITNSTINFTWNSVPGVTNYELTIFNTPSNTIELKIGVSGLNTIYTMKSGTYRAEIRACGAICGNTGPGGVVNFTVALPPPPTVAPTGLGCTVANVSNVNELTCNWNPVTGADLYVIQVIQPNTGPGGGALTVASRQVSAPTATFLIPNGTATVLVQGCTGDGCGPFSAGFGINPNFGNPTVPILGTPIGGRTIDTGNNAVTVTFSWNRIAGDNGSNFRYRIYVQDFSRQQPALDVLTTSNFHAATFNTATRYDALIQAIPVAGGNPITGPPQGFSTRGRNPNSPTPTAPQHNATGVGAGNVFLQWTPIPNAQGSFAGRLYQYYVARTGQAFPAATGLTSAIFVQVPLTGGGANYTGIMRVCNTGTNCTANSNTGWGPWSDQGEGGITNFTIP